MDVGIAGLGNSLSRNYEMKFGFTRLMLNSGIAKLAGSMHSHITHNEYDPNKQVPRYEPSLIPHGHGRPLGNFSSNLIAINVHPSDL